MRTICLVALLLSTCLLNDVEAGWKFWKKDKNVTTTESPVITDSLSTSTSAPAVSVSTPKSTGRNTTPSPSVNRGIAAAADPALALGIGSTGGNVRNNAAASRRPNPGTDVGLDITQSKPSRPGVGGNNGQGYRDWAADLTGVGDPSRQPPKLPAQGPAIGAQPNQNTRPSALPGNSNGQRQPLHGSTTARPAVTVSSITPTPTPANRQTQSTPASRSGQPTTTTTGAQNGNASPVGDKSWADVARGGSRSPSPSLTNHRQPRPSPTPSAASRSTTPQPNKNAPTTVSGSTARPGASTGAAVAAGAIAGTAAAGAGAAAVGTAEKITYSSNPTYSKGSTVTDEDLEKLSEALFIKDTNNANRFITVNLQKETTSSSTTDEAPQPLLSVKPEALQIPTVKKVMTIYDNYKLDSGEREYISPIQRQEESHLVDTFLSTNVMAAAMRFLADKGFLRKDFYEYKDTLRRLWFNLYARRAGITGSSGFEHVFLAETTPENEVSGLHNWIFFNAEESKKRLDYLGYISKVDLGNKASILKVHAKFNDVTKPVTTLFVGTSPELEMALYTVCFYARPEAQCPVSLGGTKFNIMTYKFKYGGKDMIGSAYPEI